MKHLFQIINFKNDSDFDKAINTLKKKNNNIEIIATYKERDVLAENYNISKYGFTTPIVKAFVEYYNYDDKV